MDRIFAELPIVYALMFLIDVTNPIFQELLVQSPVNRKKEVSSPTVQNDLDLIVL